MTSTMSQIHTVHPIMPESFEQVKMLDKYSDNYVYIMLEDMDKEACESMEYAYGIFNNDTLIGYCTLGSGIGVLDDIRQASETVVLSDVYILDGYPYTTLFRSMMVDLAANLSKKLSNKN